MIKETFDYIAKGPIKGPARKLVVLLHGYGVNAAFMQKMADQILKAVPDALVICPQAPGKMDLPPESRHEGLHVPPPDEAKTPPAGLTPDMQREWFSITGAPARMHADLLAVAKQMNAFIDTRRDELLIGDGDIAIMGFSQGGAVALYTALTRDKQIACVVGHSTIIMGTKDFTAKPPALLIYGAADQSFSEERYRRSAAPLKAFLPEFEVEQVKGLGHSTNAASRRIVASFIARHLGKGPG